MLKRVIVIRKNTLEVINSYKLGLQHFVHFGFVTLLREFANLITMKNGLRSLFVHVFTYIYFKFYRLYFLEIPPKQRESTLLYVNVPTSPMSITPTLQWTSLLESCLLSLTTGQMSREEQLLRERKRCCYGLEKERLKFEYVVLLKKNCKFVHIIKNILTQLFCLKNQAYFHIYLDQFNQNQKINFHFNIKLKTFVLPDK